MDVASLCRRRFCWAFALLFLMVSCGNPGEQSGQSKESVSGADMDVMASPQAKRLLRYWDGFIFKKDALANNRDDAEQKLVDFMAMFQAVPDTVVQVALFNMLDKASADPQVLDYFLGKYKHYLFDPNSPMRNEDDYGQVLAYLVQADGISEEDKIKYKSLLELVQKNRVGMAATDFTYWSKEGKHRNMYEGTSPYKMLVFYDPTCTHCTSVIHDLGQTPAVHACVENAFLDVVAVSLHPDKDAWVAYQKQIPANWTNGFDEEGKVINDGLYNIRAYPTIFLLDKENTVLLKDAPLDVTLRYLVELASKGG